ncbi:MAG: nuclear transport factor 2 family protein [Planctomycetota bacterium]
MRSTESRVADAFISAINRRAVSEILSLMTDDHTLIDSGGGVQSGRDSMAAAWEAYFRTFPDYKIRVEHILSDPGLVAVFGSACGTYNGRRGLVPENRIEMPAAWKAAVEQGKVKLWQVYADWTVGSKIISEDAQTR